MKKICFCILSLLFSVTIQAQQPSTNAPFKIAALDMDSLLSIMPEYTVAMDKAQLYYEELEKKMFNLQTELTTVKKEAGEYPSELHKAQIEDLQNKIDDYKVSAQEDFENCKEKLLEPIYEKISKASQKVAAKKGFAFVLDSSKSKGNVIFAADAYNIFDDVCKELHIPNH